MEKENNSDESDFGENEIPNSLKPFKFEPKTNIGDIISSSSDDEEAGAEYKVKRLSNNEWCECSSKYSLADLLQNRCHTCSFIKKRLQHSFFPMEFTKSLRTPFLQNSFALMAASGSKQCKPMKTYTESLCCRERNDIPERYF